MSSDKFSQPGRHPIPKTPSVSFDSGHQGVDCDPFQELISFSLDQPLSNFEATLLAEHLQDCHDCRVAARRFGEVSRAVAGLSRPAAELSESAFATVVPSNAAPGNAWVAKETKSLPRQRQFGQRQFGQRQFGQRQFGQRQFGQRQFGQRKSGQRRLSIWRLIPVAVAATVLVCLLVATWPNPTPATAEQISTAEIVQPLAQLQWLNREQQRDQALMLKTLLLDLRGLKLEVGQLPQGSPEQAKLAQQIDTMMEKVSRFEQRPVTDSQDPIPPPAS